MCGRRGNYPGRKINFSLLRSVAVAEAGANGYNGVWQKSDVRIVDEEIYKEMGKEE